jgi:hypothetical protein
MNRKHDYECYEMTFRNRPQSKYFKAWHRKKEWISESFGQILLAVVEDMKKTQRDKKRVSKIWLGLQNHPTFSPWADYSQIRIPGYPPIPIGWCTIPEIQDLVDAAIVEDVHSR